MAYVRSPSTVSEALGVDRNAVSGGWWRQFSLTVRHHCRFTPATAGEGYSDGATTRVTQDDAIGGFSQVGTVSFL